MVMLTLTKQLPMSPHFISPTIGHGAGIGTRILNLEPPSQHYPSWAEGAEEGVLRFRQMVRKQTAGESLSVPVQRSCFVWDRHQMQICAVSARTKAEDTQHT